VEWVDERKGRLFRLIDLTTQIDPAAGWARLWKATVINEAGVIGGSGPRDIQWRGFVLFPIEQQ